MLSRLLFACILGFGFAIAMLAQQQQPDEARLAARAELNQGVAAYRAANYEKAFEHFNNSVRLDPELKVARLYLATAYAQQYVPGVDTPANVDFANHALEQYAEVLQRDPANVTSIKGIAYLHLQLKHLSEAKENYKKALELDPADPETFYSVGVIDWSMVYRDVAEEKSKLNLSSQDTLMGSSTCGDLRTKELPNIEDGMAMLKQAMVLRPDYDDAMAYMNLLYRLRADLDCHDEAAHETDIETANNWVDLAMAARRKKAEAEKKRTHGAAVADSPR